MNIDIKQVNLQSASREFYSTELQNFEKKFTYALGDEWFNIIHGAKETEDYFSFFEQMGDVHYFIACYNEKIVGAACAILRNGDEGKYWYLCDVKVLKKFRGKGILEKIFRK